MPNTSTEDHDHACCDRDHGHGASSRLRWLGAFAPVLACAFCPACLTLYASILSALGLGIAFSEAEHHVLLATAVALSVATAAWRARRERNVLPFAVAAIGCAILVGGHAGEVAWLEWSGIATLIAGAFVGGKGRARARVDRIPAMRRVPVDHEP